MLSIAFLIHVSALSINLMFFLSMCQSYQLNKENTTMISHTNPLIIMSIIQPTAIQFISLLDYDTGKMIEWIRLKMLVNLFCHDSVHKWLLLMLISFLHKY